MAKTPGRRIGGDRMAVFQRVSAQNDPMLPLGAPARALDAVFVSDQLSLSLAATVFAWSSPAQADRLYSPDRLAEWMEIVGLPALSVVPSDGQLEQLRELREAVYALASARIAGGRPDAASIAVVNEAAALPSPVPVLRTDAFERDPDERFTFSGLLSQVARDVIDVVSGEWSHRLRRCARNPCSHLFVDRSPAGGRRWCTSANCGNRVRAAEFRSRKSAA